jgi:AmmeMemoRadiSam system radical SAM enzyme
MSRVVTLPPDEGLLSDGSRVGGWWRELDDGRLLCELCPRACHLKDGDRGFCFVRENRGGRMLLTTYGRSTGFCIDPIEKKPLNHFYPGTSVLWFGTAGCNLGCKFCQNWDISKSREIERLSELATPEAIAAAAERWGCHSVAFTYNDPVIWAEYAIDVAQACRERGIRTVAVTAGYITAQARAAFYQAMDAANVDLKGFTEDFYFHYTLSHLQPVLDTLEWLKKETDVWFEITNLIIPRANDSTDELQQMCDWILSRIGYDTPVHFTAFHPDFRLRDRPRTPHETLLAAHAIARRAGLKYVYVGNVHDWDHQSTYCPGCGKLLIARDWYELGAYHLRQDRCEFCDTRIAGRFAERPGNWGRRREAVKISEFPPPAADKRQGEPPALVSLQPTITVSSAPEGLMSSSTTGPSRDAAVPEGSAASAPMRGPHLSSEQQAAVHRVACEVIAAEILGRQSNWTQRLGDAAPLPVEGAFVTLKRRRHLRGFAVPGGVPDRPARPAVAPRRCQRIAAPGSGCHSAAQLSQSAGRRGIATEGRSDRPARLADPPGREFRIAVARRGRRTSTGCREFLAARLPQGRTARRELAGR